MIYVEGIGGTGKAVVNLLWFTRALAGDVGRTCPTFAFGVIDQDAQEVGVPKDVQIVPASGAKGTFSDALNLNNDAEKLAASLLFSEEELRTDVEKGFRGRPKLIAAVSNDPPEPLGADGCPVHVVVYSDIGGTGAGLGPRRLQKLLDDANKQIVIAVVFGRYLDQGNSNPVGAEWLRQQCSRHLEPGRRFLAYYVRVPTLTAAGDSSTPPPSGLNPTPALLLPVAFAWRLAQAADVGGTDAFLGTTAAQPVTFVEVGFDAPAFRLDTEDFVSTVRRCGVERRFNALIPRTVQHLGVRLVERVSAGSIEQQCWQVFRSSPPPGAVAPVGVTWPSIFAQTFSAVPDRWAAAEWFHRAVAAGEPTCRKAFLDLVWLFLEGKLHVAPLSWKPRKDDPTLFVLTTEALNLASPTLKEDAERSVVGACSTTIPFWTVPRYLKNLEAIAETGRGDVRVQIGRGGRCDHAYGLATHSVTADTRSLKIEPYDGGTSWSITFEVKRWDGLTSIQARWGLFRRALELYRGVLSTDGDAYRSATIGVFMKELLLERDRIAAGPHEGTEYYELETNGDGAGPLVSRILVSSAKPGERTTHTLLDAPTPITIRLAHATLIIQ